MKKLVVMVLSSAIPQPNLHGRSHRIMLKGDIPDVVDRPSGCAFHPRCQYAQSICREKQPQLVPLGGSDHEVACHFSKQPEGQSSTSFRRK